MAVKVRLDRTWWKKHAPESLRDGAIAKALKDFSKCSDSLERSGDAKSYFKAVASLKSAIAKDQQLAKKAKDKNALTILSEVEKLANQHGQENEGHLTIKSDGTNGLSAASGVKVPSASSDVSITIINGLDRAWHIVKDNKSIGAAKSKSCQAIPKGISAKKLSDWKTEKTSWSYVVKNRLNQDAVELRFQLRYQWNGQSDAVNGLFLTDCHLWADASVLWGYTVNVDANVNKQPFNSGSRKAVVGAIPLLVTVKISTPMKSMTKEWLITCHGNKARDVK